MPYRVPPDPARTGAGGVIAGVLDDVLCFLAFLGWKPAWYREAWDRHDEPEPVPSPLRRYPRLSFGPGLAWPAGSLGDALRLEAEFCGDCLFLAGHGCFLLCWRHARRAVREAP